MSVREKFYQVAMSICLAVGITGCSTHCPLWSPVVENEFAEHQQSAEHQAFTEMRGQPKGDDINWSGNRSKTIHLSIDIQKVYPRIYTVPWWNELKENICQLDKQLEKEGVKTVYVAYDARFKPFRNGVDAYANIPKKNKRLMQQNGGDLDLDVLLSKDQLVAFKTDNSAYQQKEIANFIEKGGYKTILLSGIWEGAVGENEDAYCISKTARDFSRAGYEVIIIDQGTQRGLRGWYDYDTRQNREALHAQWGVKILSRSAVIDGLGNPQPKDTHVP